MKKLVLIPCVAVLSACSLIPDYQKPELPVPQAWRQPSTTEVENVRSDTHSPTIRWKAFFTDPALQGLIQQALENNRDLRVATLNIEVARATYQVSRADLLPKVDANGSGTGQRIPEVLSQAMPKREQVTHQYNANLGVTAFELDLFGRLRSLNQQALESYFATAEARTTAEISLIAEVANTYLSLLGDRKQLELVERTLATRIRSLELIQKRLEGGISNELDRAQARTAVETARASRARYQRLVEQDLNALQLLVGAPVNQVPMTADLDSVRLVEDMPVGLPSDLLLRRPDIVQTEHALKAANANIGAARAAFFPKISLTALAGFASPELSNLFDSSSRAWTFAPSISIPIFDGGRNQANLDSAKANREIAVARYEKAIQAAFREVSDGLIARSTYVSQFGAQSALVDAAEVSYRLSDARYQQGIDSYLSVLDAQRSLFSAQQDLIQVQVQRLSNLVTLFKSLGGGRS